MAGLSGSTNSEGSRRYIREKIQSATWLIKSIQQRQNTIYKVTESILRFQLDFFEQGVSFLKPLVLRDVADDVGMHESTISRVVSNKYVHTPRGIFLLKYFFSSGIQRTSGENIASKSVKEEIRKLVQAEDPRKPLSDQEIVQRLEAGGIAIARRTVAKYREMMGILPSSRRKRLIKI
jgi:RNA polymerase sigma-54 factor